jgi:hypothetical protein
MEACPCSAGRWTYSFCMECSVKFPFDPAFPAHNDLFWPAYNVNVNYYQKYKPIEFYV